MVGEGGRESGREREGEKESDGQCERRKGREGKGRRGKLVDLASRRRSPWPSRDYKPGGEEVVWNTSERRESERGPNSEISFFLFFLPFWFFVFFFVLASFVVIPEYATFLIL